MDTRGMHAMVSDHDVPIESVSARSLNFGQGGDGLPMHPYSLRVPVRSVVELMADFYRELEEDDSEYGEDNHDPTTLRLRALGWPPLDRLADAEPALFARFVEESLAFNLVTDLFRGANYSVVQYLIDSVDRVDWSGDALVLFGDVIEVTPVA